MPNKNRIDLEMPNDAMKLNNFKKEYKKMRRGYREALYGFMCDIMSMSIEIRQDKNRRLAIRDTIFIKKNNELTLGILRYVTGATGKNKSKTADKWARVMNFLHYELHIDPPDFPAEIKRQGGIEKLAREAAKSRASAIEPTPDNDNHSVFPKIQIEPRFSAKIAGMEDGAEFKLIAIKESGKLIVKKVFSPMNRSAA